MHPDSSTNSARFIRAFIASDISQQARDHLRRIQQRLQRVGADIRWVLPENLHLTIVFLGDIAPTIIPPLAEDLDRVSAGTIAFHLATGALGHFGAPKRPRVIWVGLKGNLAAISSLAEAARQAALKQAIKLEARPFTPHITLGRSKSGRRAAELAAAMADLDIGAGPDFVVREINLMRSRLRAQGAVHTRLHTSPLAAR